ncbi:hypothetical protein IFM89_004661 [Coptis chinensis]|uniref:Uncharacterized protein n=1 Tax=Coptis chinensis TaxID=261450 RepID=A0A835IBS2_9MAGN|nr:hypothetical protein IFM89_004661 [Coptis chinensis]
MDKDKNKNNNKTDLIAAGRKKLQQFRKKQNTKAKSSSSKNVKSVNEEGGDATADLAASSVKTTPASPKVAEGGDNSEAVTIDQFSSPLETLPVQEVALVKEEEAVLADGQSSVDLLVSGDVGNVEGESSVSVEHEEVADSSLGPSDKSVLVRGESVDGAELASVDSLTSHVTISQEDRNEEKDSLVSLSQELLLDMSSKKETEDQEAHSLVSNQFDGMGKESPGSLQDCEIVGVEIIRSESEGDQGSVLSSHREDDKDFSRESHVPEGTEKVAGEVDEAIEREGVADSSLNFQGEGTHDDAVVSEATDEVEGTLYAGTEGAEYRAQGINEMDGFSFAVDENHKAGLSVSSDSFSREEGILYIVPEEGMEETTQRAEQTNVGIYNAGDASGVAEATYETERTPDTNGKGKSEMQLEGLGLDSRQKKIEIISLCNDLGTERKAGYMEQNSLVDEFDPVETVLVGNRQENWLDANVVLSGSSTSSRYTDTGSVNINQRAEFMQGRQEEEVNSKPERETMRIPENGVCDVLESLKQQLYSTVVAKDFFHLQLAEQTELQMDFDHRDSQLLNEISKLNSILRETKDCNTSLSVELAHCRYDLQTMAAGREETERQFAGAREELALCRFDLQAMAAGKEELETHFAVATEELANCRADLQSMAAGREEIERQFTGAREELALCKSDLEAMAIGREELETHFAIATEELAKWKSDLQDMADGREELETRFARATEETGEITARAFELQTQLQRSGEELENLLAEVASFRGSKEALETENVNLHENLTAKIDEKKLVEEEKMHFVCENESLSAQLLEQQEHFSREHDKHAQLGVDLKEAMMRLDQLTEENIFLSSSLDVHKAKLKEIESQHSLMLSQATEARDQPLEGVNVPIMRCNPTNDKYPDGSLQQVVGKVASGEGELLPLGLTEGKLIQPLEGQNFGDSIGFSDMKVRFNEAEKTMQKLDKAIERMHSHFVSLSRSANKVAGAGVSKLIQAFELKVHHDDADPTELPLEEGERSTEDHFTLAKAQTNYLRAVLMDLNLRAMKVNEEFENEKSNGKLASAALCDLQVLYEASKQQNNDLEARIIGLVKKISDYQSRTDDMHLQLYTMQQKSDEMEDLFFNKVEVLQKDVGEKLSMLEKEWSFTLAEVMEMVQNLDASVGRLPDTSNSTVQSDAINVGSLVTDSVNAATKMIEDLQQKLGTASKGLMKMHSSFESLNEKFSDLHVRNGLALEILGMIYSELKQLTLSVCEDAQVNGLDAKEENLFDLLHPGNFIYLLNRMRELLGESLLIKSANAELEFKLIDITQDVAELRKNSVDSKSFLKLVEDVRAVVQLNDMDVDSDNPSVSYLESLIASLVQKYTEASEQVSFCREEFGLKEMENSELQAKVHQLSSLSSQQEAENHIFRESLGKMEHTVEALRSELQAKGVELEQAEKRVSSVREKLSIAVAKGKGLVVQRDNLKQSLSEMSSELERCSQEVHFKDTRLQDVETKLKAYSEAGERVEALESELSYIRNSATALRDSFLLKDSVLQRIEEVLEQIELPEHFHSGDIIEKIAWLARSVPRSSLPTTDWDQKNSAGGNSYSETGFVVNDGWKDDVYPISNPGLEDLKRKMEELQSKYYVLAEQNEMLEQSLMERNNLVQRWEEVLDRMDMPLQLRSMETEEKIQWLGSALSEAHNDIDSLRKKIENFESYCGSLTADLEQSCTKVSDLEMALQGVTNERELLSCNQEKSLEKVTLYELEKFNLQNEVGRLQEKLENDNQLHLHVEGEIRRLQVLVSDALQDQSAENIACGGSDTECLEGLLKKLIEKYLALSSVKSVVKDMVEEYNAGDSDVVALDEQQNVVAQESVDQGQLFLKEEFEEALSNLAHEKVERENILKTYQSLVVDFEELGRQRDELQEKLTQEEMKLLSARDKLNVAVRKGKGLVQQRDSLKQTIEEMKTDMDLLKSELNQRDSVLVQYEQKVRDLSIYPEKVETLEHECIFLRNCLTEMEHSLQDSGHTLSVLINTLSAIDVGSGLSVVDPIKKIEMIGNIWHDMQAALTSSEHESKKTKRATELLLAELNEVHEQADSLHEELSKVEAALTDTSKERDSAEVAKVEALSRLENVISVHSQERNKELAEVKKLTPVIDQLRKGCLEFTSLIADLFPAELELFSNVEDGIECLVKQMDGTNLVNLPLLVASGGMFSAKSANEVKFSATDSSLEMMLQGNFNGYSIVDVLGIAGHTLQECTREVDGLREKCYKHSVSCEHHAKRMSRSMEAIHKEIVSRRDYWDSSKRELTDLEFMRKEKEAEIIMMRRKIALLHKACTNSILEIENRKAQLVRDGLHVDGKNGMEFKVPTTVDGQASLTEEAISCIADTLLLAVKDSASIHAEVVKNSQKELKTTISNLQEFQENGIQKNRICAELVSQIKKAEADAKTYLVDLQSSNAQVENLEKRLEALQNERGVLELRIKEFQNGETSSMWLQERIKSLTDLLSAKGQEIEDLMQALDEEELQMEGLRSKIIELEKTLQQKNLAMESLEASRGKAMAKLSTTIGKFDELHQLSESLLSEVENLQSQLQDRDGEISFLRQEVTRCTNDVLSASQEINKRNSTEMHDLLSWLHMMISRFEGFDVILDDKGCSRMEACKETLEKQITSLLSEVETLRVMAQSKDALLQVEQKRIEELSQKSDSLERFLHEKESKIASLQGSRDNGETASITSSEITEVEPTMNKRAVAPHVRSVRKVNSDQVTINIDMDPSASTLDVDDDKAHGFKSLTTSRIVPRFTRPVSNLIDGLWVSCDRALMRQPALRLGIVMYWVMLHAFLATLVV